MKWIYLQVLKTDLCLPKEKGDGGRDKLGVWDEHIQTISKIDNQQGSTV